MIRIESPEQDSSVGVNKERDGINGLIVAEEGPFKSGRGRFNRQSLERIVQLGNASDRGIRKRAQHPNASDDGLGNSVGREFNYRLSERDNGSLVVRADMKFSKVAMEKNPKGSTPWGPYIIESLSEDPGSIQNSIVVEYDEGEDELSGNEEMPKLWIPKVLKASDFVDSGDATHGESLSEEVTEDDMISWLQKGSHRRAHVKLTQALSAQLDRAFPDAELSVLRGRLTGFIDHYLSNRYGAETETLFEEQGMDKEVQAALSATEKTVTSLAEKVEMLGELPAKFDTLVKQLTEERAEREAALAEQRRSEKIASLCQQAGVANAAEYIADKQLSADDVQAKLFKVMCEKASSLGENEGEASGVKSDWDKLADEWKQNEAMLSSVWADIDEWRSFTAGERGIKKPESK